jgi:hypothetical protein
MIVEIRSSKEEKLIGNLWDGDIFVYNNETFMTLTDEIFDSGSRTRYNAVNLETGEPAFFSANTKVVLLMVIHQ